MKEENDMRIKRNITIMILTVFLLSLLVSCGYETLVDFKNDKIPLHGFPINIPDNIEKNYNISGISIWPSVWADSYEKSTYVIAIDAFSEKNVTLILKTLTCKIDGKEIVFDKSIVPRWAKEHTASFPEFKYTSSSKDYNLMHSRIYGNVFAVPTPEDKKRIDVSISVEIVFDENNSVESTIDATFFNEKRTCLVTVFGIPAIV